MKGWDPLRLLVAGLLVAGASDLAGAQRDPPSPEVRRESGATIRLLPSGHLYTPYIADRHRPVSAIVGAAVSDVGIADSGDTRYDLRLGGHFGLVRVYDDDPERGLQLDLVAGFDTVFDIDRSFDAIGWDGNYGLVLSSNRRPRVAWRVGAVHTSAHVGDEYAERTGRERIGYTRWEALVGVRVDLPGAWRAYAEGAYGWELRTEDLQDPGRLQIGLEYAVPARFWKGRLGWYAAIDLSSTEERDWQIDPTANAGLSLPSGDRLWRLGVELYDGRSNLSEFFRDDETHAALGLWVDL